MRRNSFVLAAAQSQGIPATPTTPDAMALSMVLSTYAACVNAGDAEGWISLWDTDGIQLAPGEPMHIGRPEIWKVDIHSSRDVVKFYREMSRGKGKPL